MDNNVRIAKELVKLAKSLVGIDITVKNNGDTGGYELSDRYWDDSKKQDDSKKDPEQEALDNAEKRGKKYIFYKKIKNLWRIRACKNFSDVKKGDLGGFVKSEENLSHDGNCWIYDDAMVYDNAIVCDNAKVYGNAKVHGESQVFNNAKVYGNAEVGGFDDWAVLIREDAEIYGNAKVGENIDICGHAKVHGDAKIINKHIELLKIDYEVSEGEITE